MAHDRVIRASMRSSETVSSWPFELRYFWTQLWGYCDDFGRGRYDNRLVKADLFPLDDDVSSERVGRWMQALELAGVVRAYEVDGKRYFECVNWHEHQEPQYFRKTDVPDSDGVIPEVGKRSVILPKVLESFSRREEKRREEKGKAPTGAPSPYCQKHPDGTDDPCGPCGRARVAFELALKEAKNKPTVPGIYTEPDCGKHPNRPARGCDRCAEEQELAS